MGRKGVSKRKPPKSKGPPVLGGSTNTTVSTLTHASESPVPQSLGKGEAISVDKGGKKKSSSTQQNNKRR
jgi:hypothetical protein